MPLSEEQKEELKAIKEHFSDLVMNAVNNPFDLSKFIPKQLILKLVKPFMLCKMWVIGWEKWYHFLRKLN